MELAILAAIFSGATSKILNKIGSHRVAIYTILLIQNIGGALVSLAVLLFSGYSDLAIPGPYYWAFVINMFLWPIAGLLTFYGIRHTQVSVRESLTQSRLIFAPLIATLFLGESISMLAALGTALVFAGILVAVYRRSLTMDHPDMHGIWFVLAASFLIVVASTFDKYIISGIDYEYYSFLIYAIQAVIFLCFLTKERRQELLELTRHRNGLIVFSASIFGGVFYLLQLWLLSHLPLHIAFPFIQLASASALLLAILFLNERDRIPFKIAGFSIAALGAVILRLVS